MNIDVCRKCSEWIEMAAIAYSQDTDAHRKEGLIGMCCPYTRQLSDMRLYDDKFDELKEIFEKYDFKYMCDYANEKFPDVISPFKKEHDAVRQKMEEKPVSELCKLYVEHLIGDLNK